MNLAGVRYILFDAVGTLIEARPSVAEVYANIGARFGSRLTAAQIKPRFAAALAATASEHGERDEPGERRRWQQIVVTVLDDAVDPDGQMFELLWQHFAQPSHWALYDDVAAAWSAVLASGRQPGIASNFDRRLRTVCAGIAPLADCQTLFLSSEIGFAKPDPRFFAAVTAALRARPEEILLVGDDLHCDYHGACAAGWQAVFLDRSGHCVQADSFSSLHELGPLLRTPNH